MTRVLGALVLGACLVSFAASSGWAAVTFYSEDFESLDATDPLVLGGENLGEGAGFIVFASVWQGPVEAGLQRYTYGPFPAPNLTLGFSRVSGGEGGPDQGLQQIAIYTDYANPDQFPDGPSNCGGSPPGFCTISTFVFQERTITSSDIGSIWAFTGEYKAPASFLGIADPASNATADAFIVTLDPQANFAATNNLRFDTTNASTTDWANFSMIIDLSDPALEGQLLQFGFNTQAANDEQSAVYYDNLKFSVIPIPAAAWLFASACCMLGWLKSRAA